MPERLTFTLAGRDELSRVMNGTADSADRLRLRMSGITADADGSLRDLQGRYLSVADAQRRLDDRTSITRDRFSALSDSAGKLGEAIKANLISLAPAAIPAAAGLAGSAAMLAAQFGAVALSAGAYGLALKGQMTAITEALDAQKKYDDAVAEHGETSAEAIKAQAAYQQQLDKMPPATREAAVAVGLLRDNFQDWSDSLAGDVMGPFNKGVAIANALLPRTSGLVEGASGQFDRLITLVGGAISTPGFDALNNRVDTFANRTLDHAVDELTIFLAKLDSGQFSGGALHDFWDYAQANGPKVLDTLENVGDAVLHLLEAGSGVGVGMLDLVNALSGIVSAVPPDAIASMLQLAIAIKAVRLAAVGVEAGRAAMLAFATQVGAMRASAAGAPGAIGGVTAAIGGLSRGAKLAMAGTGLGLLLITLDSLSQSSSKPRADVDKLTTSVAALGQTGKVSGEALRVYGGDLGGLADALSTLARPSNLDKTQQFLTSLVGMDSTPVKNAKEAFDDIDQALTNLVGQGKADLAAAALDNIEAKLKKQGFTAKEVESQLDDYKAALAGQALEQQLAAQSMGLFGEQAQKVQTELDAQKNAADGLRQSIVALNDVHRQGLDAQAAFEEAIDSASAAATKYGDVWAANGGKLDLSNQKGRDAYKALSDLAAKTNEATTAGVQAGASWDQVNGTFERGRQQLIKNAIQMGLTRESAKALADQILKTPDKTARLKGDLEDLKKKLAEAKQRLANAPSSKRASILGDISDLERKIRVAKDALNNLDGYSATTWIYTNYSTPHHMSTGGLLRRATGGPIPGFPGGGQIVGPGTGTSDSVLLWGSNGEYVVKAASVARYGLAFMESLNKGELPVGRAAPRPGMAAPAAAAPMVGGHQPAVTYNVYPRSSVIDVEDLRLLQRQEEARQRVGRPR
ncbi:hypothetical protein OG481_09835 [Streptomyces longwoodensis]|uniref:hypothetical protein n=1 Tax=Streptomyces longwoodensis TaxID=68231 RepID=UPI002DD86FA9|nr:hypothetical protein [Streptomyces longwoodensis]WRY88817.1 hypothetical protein OG481_09835 [Streptomyces longwoodensis]